LSKHYFHESVFLSPLVFLTSVSLLRCYDQLDDFLAGFYPPFGMFSR